MSNETAYPEAIDVVGYNYTESRYAEDHKKFPKRIIYGSENRHDLAAWKAVRDNQHIFGQFLWTGIDYLGESGTWPARGSSAGILDLAGQRKPNGWYRASLWSEKPMCYIGTYSVGTGNGRFGRGNRRSFVSTYADDTWNYHEGDSVRVVCYTNAESAHLLLNGKPLDCAFRRDLQTGVLYCNVKYEPGILRCEADNGAAYELYTSGQPVALRMTTDSTAHVFVEVVDAEGRVVKNADHEVTLTVRGARLLGMENGNIMDCTAAGRQQKNRLRVYGGRLVGYLQSSRSEEVTVRATSPFLQSAALTFICNNSSL